MARGELEDGLVTAIAAIAGAFILLNGIRFMGQSGGLSFPGTAPAGGLFSGFGLPYAVSPSGRDAIKQTETFRAFPYPDGNGESVGYGHQIQPGESFSYPLSLDQGEALFDDDIGKAEAEINSTVLVPLNQNQVDALGDFIFRIGAGNWLKSQELADLNAGDYAAAATDFSHFIRSGGVVSSALQARAGQESQQFSAGAG